MAGWEVQRDGDVLQLVCLKSDSWGSGPESARCFSFNRTQNVVVCDGKLMGALTDIVRVELFSTPWQSNPASGATFTLKVVFKGGKVLEIDEAQEGDVAELEGVGSDVAHYAGIGPVLTELIRDVEELQEERRAQAEGPFVRGLQTVLLVVAILASLLPFAMFGTLLAGLASLAAVLTLALLFDVRRRGQGRLARQLGTDFVWWTVLVLFPVFAGILLPTLLEALTRHR